MAFDLETYTARIADLDCMTYEGKVTRVMGSIIESCGPAVAIGQLCQIHTHGPGGKVVRAEVVGFRERTTVLMPVEKLGAIQVGDRVVSACRALEIGVGPGLLGRVLDGLGDPMDGAGPLLCLQTEPIHKPAPHPLDRVDITTPFLTGQRILDLGLTLGRGQRVGIFAGSGVGKSVLLGEMAKSCEADVNVIALIGERGREVGDFIRHNLGPDGLTRSVVVVATSDAPPLLKIKAAYTATTIAEYFRDQGRNVMLMMDSLTRVANAQREIGLASGEPPTSRGYPPSAFTMIPELAERLGSTRQGCITGIYTVLVDRDDMTEPVADTVRATLDGHIVLSRRLADRGHYPAVDLLASVSRVMRSVTDPVHMGMAITLKTIISIWREAEDLIKIGAYVSGTSQEIDRAIELKPAIDALLQQSIGERESRDTAYGRLEEICTRWNAA